MPMIFKHISFLKLFRPLRSSLGLSNLLFCALVFCSIVFSNSSVIAAAYDPKVRSFAEEWNLSLLNEASTSYPLFSNNEKLLTEARDQIMAIFSRGVLALIGKKETE